MNISDYGIIGNCRSSALVSRSGSIDWCCLPDFDSPSVFARLLDDEKGGYFGISVKGDYSVTQKYFENTNILETFYNSNEAAFEIYDFMPVYRTEEPNYYNSPELYRIFRRIKGMSEIRFEYFPGLNYGNPTKGLIERNFIKHVTTE